MKWVQVSYDQALQEWLLDLRENGYQPMYNGRPSCPRCENFIDEEETHDPECLLLKLEAPK